jgi:hypothetical protein
VPQAVQHPVVAHQATAGDEAVQRGFDPVAAQVVEGQLLEQLAV